MRTRGWVLLLGLGVVGCQKVEPGYVGIVVHNYGNQRGVEDFPIKTGAVWYNPATQDVYKFPTFTQNYVWTHNKNEGSPDDDSFTVNSQEGATVNFDVGFSLAFVGDSVPHLFVTFRKDADHIIAMYVKNVLRDAFSRHASRMKVTDIFGPGKQALQDSVLEDLRATLIPQGMLISQISMIGEMRVDPKVQASINAVLQAAQKAIEAENKIREAEAVADQMVKTARGDSAAAVIRAQGIAEANKLLRLQLSNELIQYEMVKKWNGTLPMVSGSAALVSLPPIK